MITSPVQRYTGCAKSESGRFCLAFLSNLAKGGGIRYATLIETEEPGDFA
jgi:hypothetical protein